MTEAFKNFLTSKDQNYPFTVIRTVFVPDDDIP